MNNRKWTGRAFGAALLVGSLGACDFITAENDPNIITTSTLPSLFVSTQLNSYVFAEGNLARVATVWTQQLAGADRQFDQLDQYQNDEETADGEFGSIYAAGGLVDIRGARAFADSVGCSQCEALFSIHEAYLVGMGASIFGDLPYRGALVPNTPAPLDPQAQVYADVQALLDEAIGQLATAPSGGAAAFYTQLSAADLDRTRAGNRAQWTAIANTMKARFYMHWVEAQRAGGASAAMAQTACGGDCLAKAEAAATVGIRSSAGDFRARHSTASSESSVWFQFFSDRAGYLVAGNYLVRLLSDTSRIGVTDPRLPLYFAPRTGGRFVGSRPGEANTEASGLATTAAVGAGARDYRVPLLTCAENFFILAEVNYYQGEESVARDAFRSGVGCAESMHALAAGSILTPKLTASLAAASGPALLRMIITEKYVANFLNIEVYNDYKRTCLPGITTFNGLPVPGRVLYGQQERQTNPNLPVPDQQPDFNANDPVRCG